MLDRLPGRKKEKSEEKTKKKEDTGEKIDLKAFCADEKIYKALRGTMLLDPRKVGISMEDAVAKAKELEKSGDMTDAKIAIGLYHTAGGLAIYEGDVTKVKQFFGKCKDLSGKKYPILAIPERAVAKAQEYYQKHLK